MAVNVIQSIVLLVINIVFILLGGYAFSVLESREDKNIERYMNISEEVLRAVDSMTDADIGPVDVENITIWQNATYFQNMIDIGCAHDKTVPWTYGQSFYYSLSVITTVGWGVMTPSSYTSKAVTCLYALVGIPIYAMFIAQIKNKCGTIFRKTVRVSRDLSWYWIPLCVGILGTIFMNITINVAVDWVRLKTKQLINNDCKLIPPYFHWQENVTLWEGIYFQFITVSTIGFGDSYHSLLECKDNSADSVMSAVVGFIFFTLLLGMLAHLFDVIADKSQTGVSSLSSKLNKRLGGANRDKYGNRTYGRI